MQQLNYFFVFRSESTMEKYINVHQKIIDKCREGDSAAQFKLYKLYYKAMYNTCFRILNNRQEAEDVMQESFLSAFGKIETYSEKVSFGAWLKRIVINKSLDYIKKRHVRFEELEGKFIESRVDESIEDTENLAMQIKLIKGSILALPDSYRVIASLYLLEGYDHDEISNILGINSSTSRSQLTRAKRKIIEKLKH